jgi:formylglycine-generating enzyme required for sulfatase activity
MQGSAMPAIERAKAGDYLAKLGDPRKSVTHIEHMEFCFVPAGPFLMGSDPEFDKYTRDEETPQHQVDMSAYYLARYPVTQAQYQLFVNDGGYANPDFWEEAIADKLWKTGKFDNRKDAKHYGGPFDLPNHPVVGIIWYEACAFARWLTHTCQTKGMISSKIAFRLPTEAQWEKASRGVEQPESPCIVSISEIDSSPPKIKLKAGRKRIYPWGDTFDQERLNSYETGIRSTSGVGCFYTGQSIYGCEEMSGNVREWCYDRYASDYYQ